MELDARMVKRLRHGAALGAYGVTAGLVLVFVGLILLTRPVLTGGMNSTMAWITWIVVLRARASARGGAHCLCPPADGGPGRVPVSGRPLGFSL